MNPWNYNVIARMNEITRENASAYIKKELAEDFVGLAKESKDESFYVAHICMLHLATHDILADQKEKLTPKQAFEKAIEHYPNVNQTMVKTLVTQFSIREEFGDWAENPERWETLWELEK